MRLSLLLAAVVLAAIANRATSQAPPGQTTDLPTVIKPIPAPSKPPETKPDAPKDPGDILVPEDPTAPLEDNAADPNKPAKGRGRKGRDARRTDDPTAESEAGAGNNTAPDYTGPSILSRGMNFTRSSVPSNERFRPFVGANFYHDSGATGKFQGPTAPVTQQTYTGADFNFGVTGEHERRYDSFALSYRGHLYVNGYSAQDHALAASYTRVLSRRLTAVVAESAGLFSNNYAVLNSFGTATDTSIANTALIVAPNTESFDDRTYYTTTQVDVAYQQSSRLSFNAGISGFLVQRDSNNLISANGFQSRADAAYRLTKRTTLGPYYAFSRYLYSGTFGDSGIHTAGLNYSWALTKRLQLRFRFGGSRLETRGLQLVVLDPAVAQILGVSTGTERYYAVTYIPDFAVDFSRSFRRGEFTASYTRGVSPGNGLILTSRRDSGSVNYTYTGVRRHTLNFGAGRDSLGAVAQQIGDFGSYYAHAGLSRSLQHDVQAILSFDYRKLNYTNNNYARNQYRISVGFAYAPQGGPLRFW